MTLLDRIDSTWTPAHEQMAATWAAALESNLPRITAAAKRFREFSPLDIHLSVSRAKAPAISFSLRFMGQEVAELFVADTVIVKIGARQAITNARDFQFYGEGAFNWRSAKGTSLRKHFKNLDPKSVQPGILEHQIESEFLREMFKGDRGKFSGTLAGIQPVTLAGCRFQFPLPLSGNSGEPKSSRGNLDMLARRGTGRGTRLSVWELKVPDARAFPIEQAYIYAVALIKMLRSSSGEFWFRNIFGFQGRLPSRLVVESVVAVSFTKYATRKMFEDKHGAFRKEVPLELGPDTIRLCAAYYQRDPLRIELIELS